ncbi:MAG: outer membrane beta-barrel protein [Xanthobacteraceae bacterium]|nr:outer membrane beta-barrel protein [Xanthobacteraceae bacterium]
MRNVKFVVAAGAILLMSNAAFAADFPIAPPPYIPPIQDFGGWYLRGDIGMTNQQLKSLDSAASPLITSQSGLGFDSSTLFGVGVGYQFNNWFRADVIGQWRGKANFHGSQTIDNGGTHLADNYTGSKSEALFLVNAYADLGTWWCITPFIGAGVGTSYNTITGFRDDGLSSGAPSVTYFADHGQWNFAWAAHAGLAYKFSPSLTMELAYSYVNLGNAAPGNFSAYDGSASGPTSIRFKDITSHDIKLGVRWAIDPMPVYQPPLVTKG